MDQRAYLMVLLAHDSILCLACYMLSPVHTSVCQMPSSVHTGSRWLVVSIVKFHAHLAAQRWYETSKDGTNSPWYEGYEKSKDGTKNPWYKTSTVRKVHLWYETSMVRKV